MITNLSIRNFQSHRKTELVFVPGVNVILGTSDSGKTAILRALRWVTTNKPGGDEFRSKWGGETSVTITTTEGHVTRTKNTSENSYKLMDGTGDESIFLAFGANVPEPISNFLNLTEVNLQQQLDAPFLLSDTPGQVAAYFNKIAGIDIIDTANKLAQKEISSTKKMIELRETDIERKKTQLEKYDVLETIEERLHELEELETSKNVSVRMKATLSQLLTKISQVDEKLFEAKQLLQHEKLITPILEKIEQRKALEKSYKRYEQFLDRLQTINEQLAEKKQLMQSEQTVNVVYGKITSIKQKKRDLSKFQAVVDKLTDIESKSLKMAEKIKQNQKVFEEHLTICPLCGTHLKNQTK